MAANNNGAAYDFDRFESRSNLAPNRAPNQQPQPQVVPRKKTPKKSKEQLKMEAKVTSRQSARILLVSIGTLLAISILIYGRVQLTELTHELGKIEKQMVTAQSENTRLNMELNSKVSLDKVEDYAINQLGMKKIQNYQVRYVNLSETDEMEVAPTTESKGWLQKINLQTREFLSYIFS